MYEHNVTEGKVPVIQAFLVRRSICKPTGPDTCSHQGSVLLSLLLASLQVFVLLLSLFQKPLVVQIQLFLLLGLDVVVCRR